MREALSGTPSAFDTSHPFCILNDDKVVVVANTQTEQEQTVFVLVDRSPNSAGSAYTVAFSNKPGPARPRLPRQAQADGGADTRQVKRVLKTETERELD